MKLKNFSLLLTFTIVMFAISPSIPSYGTPEDIWDGVAFFGDSTTHGMIRYIVHHNEQSVRPYADIRRDQILTPPSGTFYLRNIPTTQIMYRGKIMPLTEAIRQSAPSVLIVTVGVNGLAHWDKDVFSELYNRLIDIFEDAAPQCQIILQSIFPTAQVRAPHLSAFTADRVDTVNDWIREIAIQRNLQYINTSDALKDEDGWLRQEYQNGDGLHLNTSGFNRVLQTIETALKNQKGKNSRQ